MSPITRCSFSSLINPPFFPQRWIHLPETLLTCSSSSVSLEESPAVDHHLWGRWLRQRHLFFRALITQRLFSPPRRAAAPVPPRRRCSGDQAPTCNIKQRGGVPGPPRPMMKEAKEGSQKEGRVLSSVLAWKIQGPRALSLHPLATITQMQFS